MDAQGLFTKQLVSVYKEMPQVKGFLRSFFAPVFSKSKEVSLMVRRGTEKVAVDVHRYSDGNRNDFSKFTEKMMVPPLYHEYLSANEHRLYDMVMTALLSGNTTFFSEMTKDLAEDFLELQKKIDRAIELQCSQVLEFGIVSLNSMTDIDYKRKAASLVAYNAANDFSIGTVDPAAVLSTGCKFLREKGKYQNSTFNAIMGESVLTSLLNNTIMKERGKLVQYSLDSIIAPQDMPEGATFHGEMSAGSYKVRLWTYPEVYDLSGVSTPYINDKKLILLPLGAPFILNYGLVPQLISDGGTVPQSGQYLIQDFRNEEQGSHKIHIKCAPIAIPIKIDQIYTIQIRS